MNTGDWQSIVTATDELLKSTDRNRWTLGDIAGLAERHYGEGSIRQLAKDVRLPEHKTLYEYHRVSKFYDHDTRVEFPTLHWSHFREATRFGNSKDEQVTGYLHANGLTALEAARHFLAQAEDGNGWPVAKLAREIKKCVGQKHTPEKYLDVTAAIADLNGDLVMLRLPKGEGFKLSNLSAVRVAMWQTDAPAPTRTSRELLGSGDRIRRIG